NKPPELSRAANRSPEYEAMVPSATRASALRVAGTRSSAPVGLALPVAGAVLLVTLLVASDLNPAHPLPLPHFLVVSGVALVAFAIALALAVTAARAQHYKLLLLALGFMVMAGLFAVHGLSTPGVLVPAGEYGDPSKGSLAAVAG